MPGNNCTDHDFTVAHANEGKDVCSVTIGTLNRFSRPASQYNLAVRVGGWITLVQGCVIGIRLQRVEVETQTISSTQVLSSVAEHLYDCVMYAE
jgi:hypothetical protein